MEKTQPKYEDVNELSEEENYEMPSSSEDEFSAVESVEEETDEEDSGRYMVRNALCDVDDIDIELHECVKNLEEISRKRAAECKRKANDDTVDTPRIKKYKTELKNSQGYNGNHGLVVNVNSKTLVGKSADGADFIWHTLPCGADTRQDPMVAEPHYTPGPVDCAKNAKDPLQCFLLFVTEEMMESLIPPTNQKIAEYRSKQGTKSRTFAHIESTMEVKALVGLLLFAAGKKDTHLPLSVMCHVGSSGARYRSVMSCQRLRLLLQCLQCGRRSRQGPKSRGQLHESVLWETFLRNCRSNYRPGRNVTVGDQIVRFTRKGPFRLSRRPEKYGLRNTLIVDSSTKYVMGAFSHSGACSTSETAHILIESLKSSNRNITFENPVGVSMISELSHYGLTAVGILNKDDPELPKEMTIPDFEDRETRSSLFIHRDEMMAVSYKTRPSEVLCYVSSMHSKPELKNKKPEVVVSYNSNKDAVRTFNCIVDSVDCTRRTKRWTLRMFYNMLSIACANAYVVYLHNAYRGLVGSDAVESVENIEKPLSRFDFVVKLADQLTSDWVQKRLKDYRSLPADLVEQAWQSLPGSSRALAEVVDRATQKCSRRCLSKAQEVRSLQEAGL